MDNITLEYYLNILRESDPNYVVDVLGISSEELVAAFNKEAVHFIEGEY